MAINKYGSSSPIDTKPLPRPSDLIRKFDAVEREKQQRVREAEDAKTKKTAQHIIPKKQLRASRSCSDLKTLTTSTNSEAPATPQQTRVGRRKLTLNGSSPGFTITGTEAVKVDTSVLIQKAHNTFFWNPTQPKLLDEIVKTELSYCSRITRLRNAIQSLRDRIAEYMTQKKDPKYEDVYKIIRDKFEAPEHKSLKGATPPPFSEKFELINRLLGEHVTKIDAIIAFSRELLTQLFAIYTNKDGTYSYPIKAMADIFSSSTILAVYTPTCQINQDCLDLMRKTTSQKSSESYFGLALRLLMLIEKPPSGEKKPEKTKSSNQPFKSLFSKAPDPVLVKMASNEVKIDTHTVRNSYMDLVQRFPRYELLLRDLLRLSSQQAETPNAEFAKVIFKSNYDLENECLILNRALEKIKDTVIQMNQASPIESASAAASRDSTPVSPRGRTESSSPLPIPRQNSNAASQTANTNSSVPRNQTPENSRGRVDSSSSAPSPRKDSTEKKK